jgi:hypothetical protein
MNDKAKLGLLVAVIALAVAAAGYEVYHSMSGEQMQVEKSIQMPPGFKSEKQQALEGQKCAAAPESGKERDLGGPLGG